MCSEARYATGIDIDLDWSGPVVGVWAFLLRPIADRGTKVSTKFLFYFALFLLYGNPYRGTSPLTAPIAAY